MNVARYKIDSHATLKLPQVGAVVHYPPGPIDNCKVLGKEGFWSLCQIAERLNELGPHHMITFNKPTQIAYTSGFSTDEDWFVFENKWSGRIEVVYHKKGTVSNPRWHLENKCLTPGGTSLKSAKDIARFHVTK